MNQMEIRNSTREQSKYFKSTKRRKSPMETDGEIFLENV